MTIWWDSLSAVQHMFYVIAIASTLVLALQLALNLLGLAGNDVDFEASTDHVDAVAHSTGLGILSVRTIMAFFVGFGWAGVAALNAGFSEALAVLAAGAVGMLFLFMVFFLLKALMRLSDSGNVNYRNAVGQTGTVYVTLPAAGAGVGQIQVVIQGRLREMPAVSEETVALPAGTPVTVLKLAGQSTAVVRKMEVKS